jgi:streptomycin 6-kinase
MNLNKNILKIWDQDAIDPKGVMGPPTYEVGAFVRNPMPDLLKQSNVADIITQRLELFAYVFRMDKHCLQAWSCVSTVLAACHAYENKRRVDYFIAIAEIIEKI